MGKWRSSGTGKILYRCFVFSNIRPVGWHRHLARNPVDFGPGELGEKWRLAGPMFTKMNTMLDASLPLTSEEWIEWGNPNEKKAWDYMITYSPSDNVKITKIFIAD